MIFHRHLKALNHFFFCFRDNPLMLMLLKKYSTVYLVSYLLPPHLPSSNLPCLGGWKIMMRKIGICSSSSSLWILLCYRERGYKYCTYCFSTRLYHFCVHCTVRVYVFPQPSCGDDHWGESYCVTERGGINTVLTCFTYIHCIPMVVIRHIPPISLSNHSVNKRSVGLFIMESQWTQDRLRTTSKKVLAKG